jgi:hypothetical protein
LNDPVNDPEHRLKFQQAGIRLALLKADIDAAFGKHKDDITPMEMLAVAAQVVGMLLALQDQRKITVAQALAVVQANIEEGNQAAIAGMGAAQGRA